MRQNNRLVSEEYCGGTRVDTLSHLQSATKSIVSAVYGIAGMNGLVGSTGNSVFSYFPEYQSDGLPLATGGLWFSARDAAKIGQRESNIWNLLTNFVLSAIQRAPRHLCIPQIACRSSGAQLGNRRCHFIPATLTTVRDVIVAFA